MTIEGYCLKCKVKLEMKNEQRVITKNGRSGIFGTCTVCGGKIFKIVGSVAKITSDAKIPNK